MDRKHLKQRISIGFKGLSRMGKMFRKRQGIGGDESSRQSSHNTPRGGGGGRRNDRWCMS